MNMICSCSLLHIRKKFPKFENQSEKLYLAYSFFSLECDLNGNISLLPCAIRTDINKNKCWGACMVYYAGKTGILYKM